MRLQYFSNITQIEICNCQNINLIDKDNFEIIFESQIDYKVAVSVKDNIISK